jgi:hypothetical protein
MHGQMMKGPPFNIVRASKDGHERICLFLGENYYLFKPINMAMVLDSGHSARNEAHLLYLIN